MNTYFNIMVPKNHEWLPKPLYLKYLTKVRDTILNRGIKICDFKENALYDTKTNKPVYEVYMFECYGNENDIADLYPNCGTSANEIFKTVRCA